MTEYNKENPLRVFEAFAGYGPQSLALERLKRDYPDFDYRIVGFSDIEPAAITAYHALHGDDIMNYGDISKIDWDKVPDFDLFTMSSPCQDFSQAGLQRGGVEGSGTRSSLLWECTRAIDIKRPRYIFFENVQALVSQKFIKYFNAWQHRLSSFGYHNYAQVMNSADYNVPQHRERIIMISEHNAASPYFFPKKMPLKRTLSDVLEKEVDERYFLQDSKIVGLLKSSIKEKNRDNGFKFVPCDQSGVAHTLKTQISGRKTDNFIESVDSPEK